MQDIERCRSYFEHVYDETYSAIRRQIAYKVRAVEDIEDILQEVYCEYYKSLLKRGIGFARDDRACIASIAKRKIYQFYAHRPAEGPPASYESLVEETGEPRRAEAEDLDLEDFVIDSVILEQVWQKIDALPDFHKKIFYLYYVEELSFARIAAELGRPLYTVKYCIYSNLKRIRQEIVGHSEEKEQKYADRRREAPLDAAAEIR